MSGNAAPYLNGVYDHENHVVAVFDLERFLLSPEVRRFE
jgi:chemotaxis signal transduction protein